MSIGGIYWNKRFARWGPRRPSTDGYSLIIPVPGDLPVMLEIALAVTSRQSSENRVATLIVADRPSSVVDDLYRAAKAGWDGQLELVPLPKPEAWFLPVLNNGWKNHGTQIIAAVSAAASGHVILHDADLFLMTDDFLESHFKECSSRQLACLGVQPVIWDTFYEEHGRRLAATWEICASVDWIRDWPPAMHMAHAAELWGERHSFDTMLHPQCLTDADRVAIVDQREADFVHFGYVTATYRLWQKRKEAIVDDGFTHLLIRTMIDVFSSVPDAHRFPSAAELAGGLTDPSALIRYPEPAAGGEEYRGWRTKLDRALSNQWVSDDQRRRAAVVLAAFDAAYL